MSARSSALALGLAFLVPAGAAAQGLGDTAAREREKRIKDAAATKQEPARVFTNDDLGEGRKPGDPARIAYWWGKVNQHRQAGRWVSDPDGVSGASIDKLEYCRKWFPGTVAVRPYQTETIAGWKEAGNVGSYSNEVTSDECVIPAESASSKGSARASRSSETRPESRETNQESRGANASRESNEDGEGRASPAQSFEARVAAAESRVSGVEQRVKQLTDKLNPMSGSFIYGATGSNDPQEEARVRTALTQAQNELIQARRELTEARQALEDFRRRSPTER